MSAARPVLALVVALQLVAETALTPYWPRLLQALFGVEELAATGTYLTVCRIAGLAALPLWGLAARRWPLRRLLVAGLLGSAVFDLGLALAPSLALFTALSAGVVATGSSMVLAYPALVAVADRNRHGDRLSPVVVYAAVFHATAVLATLIGAGVVALPQPRLGLAAFAVADLVLAVAVWRAVADRPAAESTTGGAPAAPPRPASEPSGRAARRLPIGPLVAVAALAVLVDVGIAVPRPFFTELVLRGGGSLIIAAALFLLPAVAALAVLPAARPLLRRWGPLGLPVAAAVAALGLVVQALGSVLGPAALTTLAAGRVVFGLGLGLVAVAVDLRVFAVVGTDGPGFTVVETARSGALLAAPLLATTAASVALPGPLVVAAVFVAAAAAVAAVAPAPTDPSPTDHSPTDHSPADPATAVPALARVPEVIDDPAPAR